MDIIAQTENMCRTLYTDEEVEEARLLVSNKVAPTARLRKRRGEDARSKMIEDTVNVLQGIQPDVMPMFAVYDLSRLPPLDLNSVDVTNMTQDIRNIRKDMSHNVVKQGKIDQMQDQLQKVMNKMYIISQQMSEVVKVVQTQKDNKVLYSDVTNETRPKDDTHSKGTLLSLSPVRR